MSKLFQIYLYICGIIVSLGIIGGLIEVIMLIIAYRKDMKENGGSNDE